MKTLVLYFSLLFPAVSFAQSRSIDWHKIAGGGGTNPNGRGAGGVDILTAEARRRGGERLTEFTELKEFFASTFVKDTTADWRRLPAAAKNAMADGRRLRR